MICTYSEIPWWLNTPIHCGKNFESKAFVRISKVKSFLHCGQLQSISSRNASSLFSKENLSNYHSSDVGTPQVSIKNCGSMNLSDGNLNRRRQSNL